MLANYSDLTFVLYHAKLYTLQMQTERKTKFVEVLCSMDKPAFWNINLHTFSIETLYVDNM